MAEDPLKGLFVVIEAADGSGKTTIVDHLVPALLSTGRVVRRIDRALPDGDHAHADLVRAVDRLFRSADATDAGWEHLSLAAAVQYRSILHAQIAPAIAAGEIVIAESWWDKTWIRLGVEAAIYHGHSPEQQHAFTAWQRSLLPADPQCFTVHIDTAQEDRTAWYRAAGCPDPYLDHTGNLSHDPHGFGCFTERIATGLRALATELHWPTVTNDASRTAASVAAKLHRLIADRGSTCTRRIGSAGSS
ncbi:hypothetical protein [Streptomyces seoulensis]|uniref:hypothetical protein n=1 Tax=Streptomyces seoulensis TaxID=73044 RepID=UPI001FCBE298|nr:hypothetical protein [Streptomyces seoulensis]BDH07154.1 hypothetical protein HEK131_43810 [Streptomyces seoulensis]